MHACTSVACCGRTPRGGALDEEGGVEKEKEEEEEEEEEEANVGKN